MRPSASPRLLLLVALVVPAALVMVVSVVMPVALVMIVALVMTLTMAMSLISTLAPIMVMPVSRHVFTVVPIIAHEVDRSTAGVVFRAMLAPVLLVTRPHMQVDRRG